MRTLRLLTFGLFVAVVFGLACLATGCVTPRDKIAVVRGSKFAKAEGSPLGKAVGAELEQVAADIGADKIDPAIVALTPEAATENAQGIARERSGRQLIVDTASGLLKDLLGTLPYGGPIAGAAAALWALWRKGRVQKVAGALSQVVDAYKTGTYHDGMTAEVLDAVGASKDLAADIRALAKKD